MAKLKGQKHQALRLSALQVQSVIKQKESKPRKFADGQGLYLVVAKSGSISWIFRYSYGINKNRELNLGTASELTLAEARERREKAVRHLAAQRDPGPLMSAAARRQQEQTKAGVPKFLEAARAYIVDAAPGFKSKKTVQAWNRALLHYAKPLHDKPINAITTDDVADVLKPVWRTRLETARKLRWRLEAVFAEAIPKGFRNTAPNGEMIHIKNPAQWDDNLAALAAFRKANNRRPTNVRHHSSLPYKELPSFYLDLEKRESSAVSAMRLAILTACRTSEILGARWNEINFELSLWTIPAYRMKADREHQVPLSDPANELLRTIVRFEGHPFVFVGKDKEHHLSNMSMLMLLRRMGRTDITPHGFRSTFRTWAQECTSFPREVAEMALAHLVGSAVERSYAHSNLLEKRKELMAKWAEFVLGR